MKRFYISRHVDFLENILISLFFVWPKLVQINIGQCSDWYQPINPTPLFSIVLLNLSQPLSFQPFPIDSSSSLIHKSLRSFSPLPIGSQFLSCPSFSLSSLSLSDSTPSPSDALIREEPFSIKPRPPLIHQSVPQQVCYYPPTRTHPMVTCSQNNIFKPKTLLFLPFLHPILLSNLLVSHMHWIFLSGDKQCLMSSMLLSRIKLSNLFLLILNIISLVASGFFKLRKILVARFLNKMPVLWPKAFTNDMALTTSTLSVHLSSLPLFTLFFALHFHKIGLFSNLMWIMHFFMVLFQKMSTWINHLLCSSKFP